MTLKAFLYIKKNVSIACLGLLLLLFNSFFLQAQKVEVKASLDTLQMLIGEQVRLQLAIEHDENIQIVKWPAIGEQIGDLEVVEISEIDSSSIEENLIKRMQTFTVTSFDTGYFAIPRYKFMVKDLSKNASKSLQTEPLLLTVQTVAVDPEKDILPIKPIMAMPFSFREAIPYILAALGLLVALITLVFLILRLTRKKEIEVIKKEVQRTPYEIAMEKLHQIEQEKAWEKGSSKVYYSQLTDIMREYLEGHFEIPALESTSDEIVEALNSVNIKNTMKKRLKELLYISDMAKFAKAKPTIEENARNFKDVKEFVKRTHQQLGENIKEETLSA